MKKKNIFLRLLLTVVFAFILFYLFLPAINFQTVGFYIYLLLVLAFFKLTGIINIKDNIRRVFKDKQDPRNFRAKGYLYLSGVVLFILIVLINIICSPLFISKKYSKRIVIDETSTFTDDIKEIDFNKLPLLDKESSQKLGDRVMGQMSELVSQFEVSDLYTQINYNNDIARVTPLEYASFFKWLTNRSKGAKGYITVNSVTGKSELKKLDKGMKYLSSAYFNDNLYRKLRFSYPTKAFGRISFEIDNDGNPYWIVPTLKYTAIELMSDVNGIIMLDPITGDSKFYKVGDIPTWVDQVYDSNLIIEQVDDWGMYKNGFLNSIFGQKGVVQTSYGYNYTIQDDDVYMYTGITSINSDESNIGFILTNLRTKETKFYSVPGAEEYSAMDSAKGQVQQMDYTSSFPLLVNLNSRPTYLLSLKDKAGLVKMYAFVDVEDYQQVVVTDSSLGVEEAARSYLSSTNFGTKDKTEQTKKITINSITNATIDGITYYYIVDTNNQKYKVSIKVNEKILPFLNKNDTLNINYLSEKEVITIISIN